jgi:predicted neuraminidase
MTPPDRLFPHIPLPAFAGVLALLAVVTASPLHAREIPDAAVLKSEFLNGRVPTPQCHASTIAETPEGLVAAWFGGTKEKYPDVGIWLTYQQSGGWTEPVEVATGVQEDGTRLPCWNPVLFMESPTRLLLFYKVGPSPDTWWGMLRISSDSGRTWSAAERLPKAILGPIKNKPVRLANGDILSPTSSEHAGWRVHFERSADGGRTWTAGDPINDGVQIGIIQPSILLRKDGSLQAIGRSQQGKVFTTESRDSGRTWAPVTFLPLPNPNAGTDAVTLQDGRHLLVYNHTTKGRSPLNIAISENGTTWQAAAVLEDEPGEFSYPAVIQTRDGLIHITYTWKRQQVKHVVIDPTKLVLRPMVAESWPK